MATYDQTPGSTSQVGGTISASGRVPYLVSQDLNWATAATAAGATLAAGDIIQLIDVPAHTMIIGVGAEVTTAANSTGNEVISVTTSVSATTWVQKQPGNSVGYMAEKATAATFGELPNGPRRLTRLMSPSALRAELALRLVKSGSLRL